LKVAEESEFFAAKMTAKRLDLSMLEEDMATKVEVISEIFLAVRKFALKSMSDEGPLSSLASLWV